jgi:hypothetical protein
VICNFQERLLSPTLSSIRNGGEGVATRAIDAALFFKRNLVLLIPSPCSEARGEGQGEGQFSFSKTHFIFHS